MVRIVSKIQYVYLRPICILIVAPKNLTISGGDRFNISSQVNLTCTAIGVPLPTIVWQLNGVNVSVVPDCVLNLYNATSMTVGLNNCAVSQTLNLVNASVASTIMDPQDVSLISVYNLDELAVVSHLFIRPLQRRNNGSYTCTVNNMLPVTDTVSVVSGPTHVVVLGEVHNNIFEITKLAYIPVCFREA